MNKKLQGTALSHKRNAPGSSSWIWDAATSSRKERKRSCFNCASTGASVLPQAISKVVGVGPQSVGGGNGRAAETWRCPSITQHAVRTPNNFSVVPCKQQALASARLLHTSPHCLSNIIRGRAMSWQARRKPALGCMLLVRGPARGGGPMGSPGRWLSNAGTTTPCRRPT